MSNFFSDYFFRLFEIFKKCPNLFKVRRPGCYSLESSGNQKEQILQQRPKNVMSCYKWKSSTGWFKCARHHWLKRSSYCL